MGRRLAFDEVVGLIYEAALQPKRWPAALDAIAGYVLADCGRSAATEVAPAGGSRGPRGAARAQRCRSYGSSGLARLRRLLPHLRRAALIHRLVGGLAAERAALAAALHELAVGIAFVAADLRVVWLNRAAEAILGAGDGIAARGGRLCAATTADAERLRQLTKRAAGTPRCCGEMLVSRGCGQPLALLVMPGPDWAPGREGATALLLLTDPQARLSGLAERIRRMYGLTKAEARVAEAVLDGKRPEEIAGQHSVSLATVRSQLHAALAKTDTTRQSELVRLLASLPARHHSAPVPGAPPQSITSPPFGDRVWPM